MGNTPYNGYHPFLAETVTKLQTKWIALRDCDLLPVGSITVRAAFMSPIRGCGHALAVVQVEEY